MNALKDYACNMKIAINTSEEIRSKLSPEDKKKIEDEIEKTLQWVDFSQLAEEDEITGQLKELRSICKPMFFNILDQGDAAVDGSMNRDSTTAGNEIEEVVLTSRSSSSFKKGLSTNVASSLALATLSNALVDASGLAGLVDVMEIVIPSGSSSLSYKKQLVKKLRRYIVSTAISAAIGDVTGLSGQLVVDALVSASVEKFLHLRGLGKAQTGARPHDPQLTKQHKRKLKDV